MSFITLWFIFIQSVLFSFIDARHKGNTKSNVQDQTPITVEISCDDEVCCSNFTVSEDVEITLEDINRDSTKSGKFRSARIVDLLEELSNINGSDYSFAVEKRYRLSSLAGLCNDEECKWTISIDQDTVSPRQGIRSRIAPGQTVSFTYVSMEEDQSSASSKSTSKTSRSASQSEDTEECEEEEEEEEEEDSKIN